MSLTDEELAAWECARPMKCEAPEGYEWQCGACGKRTHDRVYGTGGWDESCFLHSRLVPKATQP